MGVATLRSGYTLHVDAWVASQNKAENYSIIAWRRYVKKDSLQWYRGQWAANTERVWSNVGQHRETSGWWYDFKTNTVQLDASGTFRLNHDANGNASYEVASYVNIVQIGSATASSGRKAAKRIPVAPKAPGKPVVSDLKPTSLKLTWPAPSDMGGAAFENYRVSYWPNKTGAPPGKAVTVTKNSVTLTDLLPGSDYYIVVQAKNKESTELSPYSQPAITFTPPGARIRHEGVWKMAIPYVRVNGVWKMASPLIRKDGVWETPS